MLLCARRIRVEKNNRHKMSLRVNRTLNELMQRVKSKERNQG